MAIKNFLDWSQFTTRGSGLELFGNAIRKSLEFNQYGDQTTFRAVALTDAYPLQSGIANLQEQRIAGEESEASSELLDTIEKKLTNFILKARILGDNSPHSFLPDPCDPTTAADPDQLISIIKMHTSFVSTADSLLSDEPMVKKGDIIWVELKKNVFSYDLQFGKFLQKSRDKEVLAETSAVCGTLSTMDWGSGVVGEGATEDPGGFSWSNRQKQYTVTWQSTEFPEYNGKILKNGEIEDSGMLVTDPESGAQLVQPAMNDFLLLAAAYKAKFNGKSLTGYGYRTYTGQVSARMIRVAGDQNCGNPNGEGSGDKDANCKFVGAAATPGRSNHGWGAAIDLRGSQFRSAAKGGTAPDNEEFKWINKFSKNYNFVFGVNGEHWHLDWIKYSQNVVGLPRATAQNSWTAEGQSDDSITLA
tara:strand:+ start:23816 stop:25066 length:1251 start_codon:yes stop_codon:yes gene_type:complete